MTLDQWIKEVKERCEKLLSMRSDDFGHDTHALLVAESKALQVIGDDLEKAIKIIAVMTKSLESMMDTYEVKDRLAFDGARFFYTENGRKACVAIEQAEEIVRGKE